MKPHVNLNVRLVWVDADEFKDELRVMIAVALKAQSDIAAAEAARIASQKWWRRAWRAMVATK